MDLEPHQDEIARTLMECHDDYDTSQRVPLEAKAGTLIALHGSLPHWSGPNTSAEPRHAYTVHIIDGEAHYLPDNWLQRSADLPLRGFSTLA